MPSQVQNYVNTAADTAMQMSLAGGMGYICARLFTSLNPLTGAAFCATMHLVQRVAVPVFDDFFAFKGASDSTKLIGTVLGFITGVAASAAITTAVVNPISFYTGFVLSIMTVALSILVYSGVEYCFGASKA